jgi:hypothetical protein
MLVLPIGLGTGTDSQHSKGWRMSRRLRATCSAYLLAKKAMQASVHGSSYFGGK